MNLMNEFNTSFSRELLSLYLLLWGQTLGGQFLRRFTKRLKVLQASTDKICDLISSLTLSKH